MKWIRGAAGLLLLSTLSGALDAQTSGTGRVTGHVMDRVANAPISNVSVLVVGTTLGARTSTDGQYVIAGVPAGSQRVRVTRIGYAPTEQTVNVKAGDATTVDFSLAATTTVLDQMVVVGYGTQRRSDLTGSVSTVTPHVDQTPTVSLEQALQGGAPGVQVTQASSAPGGGISIRIRGGSSVTGSNEPLYVIDGFPIENDPNNSSPTNGGRDPTVTVPADPLASINPEDIESIQILKDASATSIYGARGANGVVIITTKHGAAGVPRVTVDSYTGMQSIAKRYDLLSPRQFVDFANAWGQAQSTPTTPFTNPDSVAALGTDWQSQIFQTAPMSNLQIGVTGGTSGDNQTRYAISGGTLQQEGIVRGSDFRRISMRGNLDQQVGSKLHFMSNLNVSRITTNSVPTDGSFNSGAGAVGAALQYIPILPVRQADGTYSLMSSNYPNVLAALGLAGGSIPNPVASALDVQDQLGDVRTLANVSGDFQPIGGLTLRANVGADLSNRTRDTYYPSTTLQGQGVNGHAIRGTLSNTSWLSEFTADYTRALGEAQRFDFLGGYTRQATSTVNETLDNSNFVSDITGYNAIGAGAQPGGPTVTSASTRWTLASYLGRANYTLLDRYLFTLTGREDGSSRFGANSRWGFFPSAAFGWRVSEEPFLRNMRNLDQLKLRVSYGLAGNPSILPYQSLTHLSAGQYAFGSTVGSGYYPSVLGNPDLTWETTRQTDIGLDLGLYQSRVEVTADYYNKRTSNLLLSVDLPAESGFSTAYENAGSIQNRGFELGLTLDLVRSAQDLRSFGWQTTFSYSLNRNKVLSLGGPTQLFASSTNSDIKATGTLVQVGQPLGVFYGYKTAGIFRDSAQLAAWTAKTKMGSGSQPGLGNSVFVDVNGDGVIDANDRTIIGDPNPKFLIGWQNTLSFRGFQLIGLFDGSFGAQIMNLNLYRVEGASPSTNVLSSRFYDAWSPTNPNGKYPKVGAGLGFLGSDFTDELVEGGSYFRLRNLSLSHEIPSRLLHGYLQSARAYVTGQNLHTWTKYDGFNPDVSSEGVGNLNRGIDIGAYPLARTFIFGINVGY